MTGPVPPSFNKGRLVLVLVGVAAGALAAWLLLKRPEPPRPVAMSEPQPAAEQPITYYLARADAARGEAYFARCASCHTIDQGGRNSVGPNLWAVMGSAIGTRPDFTPSPVMSAHGGSWDWESMNRFLRSPRTFLPGTRMTFAGVTDPQDRADVMLYMNRQGGALPTPAMVPGTAR